MKNFKEIPLENDEREDAEEEEVSEMDKKHNSSLIREFHNQKKGDFDTKTGTVYRPGTQKHNRNLSFIKGAENKEEEKEFSKNIKHFEDIISNINEVELKTGAKDKEAQELVLNEDKEISEELLRDVLDAVKKYINSIKKGLAVKQEMSQGDTDSIDYKEKMKIVDQTRRFDHNTLIDNINILNRFLNDRFGKLSKEKIESLEKNSKRDVVDVERIDIPKNGVCPDNIDISNRKEIARWAFQVYDSLTDLEDLFKEGK